MRLIQRWMAAVMALFLFFSALPEVKAMSVSAKSAILMEQSTGRVLFEKDAHTKRRIASITKIMTAILAIESGKMDEMVTVSERAVRTEGSSIYLKPNEKIELKHLVYGLMLRSGNDAAVAIAEHVGGSVEGFVFLMNEKAAQIGMRNTEFANPHGLDDAENHYSTAYDMALLMRYAMQNKQFREISGTKVHRAPNPEEKWDRIWRNKNKLLTNLYEYCTGGKTGYTKRAKRTLVTTASKDAMDLIAVTINAGDDWNDHIAMYEHGFDHYMMTKISADDIVEDIDDPFYKKRLFVARDFLYPLTEKEQSLVHIKRQLLKPRKDWSKKDVPNVVGRARLYIGDEKVDEMPIFYENGQTKKEKHSFFHLFRFLGVGRNG
jgi:D-alanyl-D-alanine carboxypeptidase (penicillin-binding protein 5/6)